MSLGIRVDGGDGFFALRIQQEKLSASIRQSIRDLAQTYRTRLVNELSRPKSGRQYGARKGAIYRRQRVAVTLFGGQQARVTRNVRGSVETVAYKASAPGEPPARRTGNLIRAVRVKLPAQAKGYGAKVFAHRGLAFYRHFLEFGTNNPDSPPTRVRRKRNANKALGRVLPRPVFSPLSVQLDRDLSARVIAAVEAFARGA